MVSTMMTSMTMVMEMMAAMANCGGPKWNGVDTAIHGAWPMRLKSALPSATDTSAPRTRPARMAMRLRKPGRNR